MIDARTATNGAPLICTGPPLTAADIFGRPLTPAPWPSSKAVLARVAEILPTIKDDVVADVVEHLHQAIVDLEVELAAVRAVLSEALTQSHTKYIENGRLRKRLADVLDARQRDRTAALSCAASIGQHSAAQDRAEERSPYEKRRAGTVSGSRRPAQHRTA